MSDALVFRLSDAANCTTPTLAEFSVWVGDAPIWPVAGNADASLEVFIDDILDYLADFWTPLLLRQTYPLPFEEAPERPTSLSAVANQRWLKLPEMQAETEQSVLSAFEAAHNLATCFDGQFALPPLWLLRQRDRILIDTTERLFVADFEAAVASLEQLGEKIAKRLERSGEKYEALIEAWRDRASASGARMLEFAAGIPAEKACALIESSSLAVPRSLQEAANDDDEILIAARIAGGLPIDDIRRVISLAKSFAPHPAEKFRELATAARQHLDGLKLLKPHEFGETAARFVRSRLAVEEQERLDIRALVEELGVEVKSLDLSLRALDGLAIIGLHHGPGILLNRRSQHLYQARELKREAMLRFTLAHELCHLLFDGDHPFTAVDVLSARMPPSIESRAQAFAGEFLLPTRLAGMIWQSQGRPTSTKGLGAVISQAVERSQVTRSVAAWKIEHAANLEDVDLHAILGSLARYR